MSEHSLPSSRSRGGRTWPGLAAACVIAFCWSFLQALMREPDPALRSASAAYSLGYLVGGLVAQSAFIGLMVWLVLYFAYVRSRDPDRGPMHFLALFGSAGAGALLFAGVIGAAILGGANDRAAADAAFEQYGVAVVALDRDLARDANAVIGVGGAIDSLEGPESLPAARARLEALLPRIEEAEADVEQLQSATIESLRDAGVGELEISEFQRGHASANALRDRATNLMRRIVQAQLSQIEVLENAGAWRVTANNVFEFERGSDLASFNAIGAQILELTAENEILREDFEAHGAEAP